MDFQSYFPAWEAAMRAGEISNTVFSELTIVDYVRRAEILLDTYGVLNFDTFKTAMRAIDPAMKAKKAKLYKAVVCFAKFLHAENVEIDKRLVIVNGNCPPELAPFRPKPNKSPKQVVVSYDELQKLKSACHNEFERLIVVFLSTTGLRASEACRVTVGDLDLTGRIINNVKGKGGKIRRVALQPTCVKVIQEYLATRPGHNEFQALFIRPATPNLDSKIFNRHDLGRTLDEIGKRVSVKPPPHSMRRAFVTIGHAKGAPMDYLKMSCGHADIKTTIGYCKTAESETLDFMKNLDFDPDETE